MNEDEILSFDYRSPVKKKDDAFIPFISKTNNNEWEKFLNLKIQPLKLHIPKWCEIGTKCCKENIFGIIVNVFRSKRLVAIKWDNDKIDDYDLDFLVKLVYKGTIEILYE